MKEEGFVIGMALGGLAAALLASQREQHATSITKRLVPITWASEGLDPMEPFIIRETHKPMELQKAGLEFSINGVNFLVLFDSGATVHPIMLDQQTAELLQINRFHRSSAESIRFPGVGVSSRLPIYSTVPLTLPGVETIITDVIIGGNNLINPLLFLDNWDITFHGNYVIFTKKGYVPHLSTFIPYTHIDRDGHRSIDVKIGDRPVNTLLDTGSVSSLISNDKLAREMGVDKYRRTPLFWNNSKNKFDQGYFIPVQVSRDSLWEHFKYPTRSV